MARRGDSSERRRAELKLQMALGSVLTAVEGWSGPEKERAFERARVLCQDLFCVNGNQNITVLDLAFYRLAPYSGTPHSKRAPANPPTTTSVTPLGLPRIVPAAIDGSRRNGSCTDSSKPSQGSLGTPRVVHGHDSHTFRSLGCCSCAKSRLPSLAGKRAGDFVVGRSHRLHLVRNPHC